MPRGDQSSMTATPAPSSSLPDSDQYRLDFILAAQVHCDHFLTPIADPRGKSVLVVGAGAGTEMLWCVRHGATEVVGIDILEQSPEALHEAIARLDPRPSCQVSLQRCAVEDAGRLGRTFDLVLSNNVFEHVPNLGQALEACSRLMEPDRGRLAIFTDPIYFSSAGAHLPLRPWEHLWGDPVAARERLLESDLDAGHPLAKLDLDSYLHSEISLNRMRLVDFLEAAGAAGLTLLNLRVMVDREVLRLHEFRDRLRERQPGVTDLDFALEGIAAEFVRLGDLRPNEPADVESTEAHRRKLEDQRNYEQVSRIAQQELIIQSLKERIQGLGARCDAAETQVAELRSLLTRVEDSWSFRIGRAVTAPGRWLRRVGTRRR